MIQAALLEAVQLQLVPAVTVALAVPPLDANEAVVGEMEYVQPAAAASVTVNVCPAMVNVPVREVVLVLAATE